MGDNEQIDVMPANQDDELGKLSKDALIGTLNKDIEQYKKHLEQLDKDEKNYGDQLEIDEKIWAILEKRENYGTLEPRMKFEALDEYWDLQHQKLLYKIREDRHLAKRRMDGYAEQRRLITKDMEDKQAKLKDMTGDVE
jgi:hypothetical protein